MDRVHGVYELFFSVDNTPSGYNWSSSYGMDDDLRKKLEPFLQCTHVPIGSSSLMLRFAAGKIHGELFAVVSRHNTNQTFHFWRNEVIAKIKNPSDLKKIVSESQKQLPNQTGQSQGLMGRLSEVSGQPQHNKKSRNPSISLRNLDDCSRFLKSNIYGKVLFIHNDIDHMPDIAMSIADFFINRMSYFSYISSYFPNMSSIEDDIINTPFDIVGGLRSQINQINTNQDWGILDIDNNTFQQCGNRSSKFSNWGRADLQSPYGAQQKAPSPPARYDAESLRQISPHPAPPPKPPRPKPAPKMLFEEARRIIGQEDEKALMAKTVRAYLDEFDAQDRSAQALNLIQQTNQDGRLLSRVIATIFAIEREIGPEKPDSSYGLIKRIVIQNKLADQAIFINFCFGPLSNYNELKVLRNELGALFIADVEKTPGVFDSQASRPLVLDALYVIAATSPDASELSSRAYDLADTNRIRLGDVTIDLLIRAVLRTLKSGRAKNSNVPLLLAELAARYGALLTSSIKLEMFVLLTARELRLAPMDVVKELVEAKRNAASLKTNWPKSTILCLENLLQGKHAQATFRYAIPQKKH